MLKLKQGKRSYKRIKVGDFVKLYDVYMHSKKCECRQGIFHEKGTVYVVIQRDSNGSIPYLVLGRPLTLDRVMELHSTWVERVYV
jgi:hypothetical protein